MQLFDIGAGACCTVDTDVSGSCPCPPAADRVAVLSTGEMDVPVPPRGTTCSGLIRTTSPAREQGVERRQGNMRALAAEGPFLGLKE